MHALETRATVSGIGEGGFAGGAVSEGDRFGRCVGLMGEERAEDAAGGDEAIAIGHGMEAGSAIVFVGRQGGAVAIEIRRREVERGGVDGYVVGVEANGAGGEIGD